MTITKHYDAVVVGTGGIGSAALYHLAARGVRSIGLDRFPTAHNRGSSHGQTRLIRQAYFEHPDYVPLLLRSYQLWRELEKTVGRTLLVENGLLLGGPVQGAVLQGVQRSAAIHNLSIERISPAETTARWPSIRLPQAWEAIYEARAGYLFVEECVRAHIEAAIGAGAHIRHGVTVRSWQSVAGGGVVVRTDGDHYTADRLVLAPGSWAADLLNLPAISLRVLRKSLFWYAAEPAMHTAQNFPCFAFDDPNGFTYGFPAIDARGVKIAEHTGGKPVHNPLQIDRTIDPAEQQRVEQVLADYLPGKVRKRTSHEVCLYTMSRDSHFLVGPHPDHPCVAIAAGFSGHGFKFASVMGEILADLATGNASAPHTSHAIGFLSPQRFVNL